MIRVLLADDQQLVRSGFSLILSVEAGIEVVGQAANGREAVDLAAALRPDVVLMDVQMPVLDGIAATREVTGASAGSADGGPKVVILTTFDRDDYVLAGLEAGASGFLLKNSDADQLVEAVRVVADGHALLAPEVTRRVIEQATRARHQLSTEPPVPQADSRLAHLTPRELEVLRLVARGLSNAEIAGELFVGEATVKTHLSSVFAKLHLRDRVQAVVLAYESGLLRPGEAASPPAG